MTGTCTLIWTAEYLIPTYCQGTHTLGSYRFELLTSHQLALTIKLIVNISAGQYKNLDILVETMSYGFFALHIIRLVYTLYTGTFPQYVLLLTSLHHFACSILVD